MKRIRPPSTRTRSPSIEGPPLQGRKISAASLTHNSLSLAFAEGNCKKEVPIILNGLPHNKSDTGAESGECEMDTKASQPQQQILEKVAILDVGAQYGKLIDRSVRECNVYSELLPLSTPLSVLLEKGYKAVIISGGPSSVYADNAPLYDQNLFFAEDALPILGICYGFQLINKVFGGGVARESIREDGTETVQVENRYPLFDGLDKCQEVLLTHGDSVTVRSVGEGLEVTAYGKHFIAGVACVARKIYGVQFHPEVDLTEHGEQMIRNFLRKVAGLSAKYTMDNREHICINKIRQIVGDQEVLVMVSGGVDSTVCAALLHKALGPTKVHAIHIDNGFMRLHESDKVMKSLQEIGLTVHRFNFIDEFLNASLYKPDLLETPPLCHVIDPETKRNIIGDTFIRCKDKAIGKLHLDSDIFLAQGTLRPDLIESANEAASTVAVVIKTHHNDTALVRKLRDLGKVIEPLQDFHKDEVRELGKSLGLPEHIVNRHPFPGPGLAIRILCADEPFKDAFFEKTQEVLQAILQEHTGGHLRGDLLPIKSVGVQGDSRSYSYVAAISGNYPTGYLQADKWVELTRLAKEITKQAFLVNRVVYLFGDRLSRPVEDVTYTRINEVTLGQLQQADNIVYEVLCGTNEHGEHDPNLEVISRIQQMPVILVPLHFDRFYKPPQYFPSMQRSICLRPFITRDFMTGRAAILGKDLPEKSVMLMVHRITKEVPNISRVMLDLTSKPPGTTEWE